MCLFIFSVGQFEDDKQRTRLRTLLAQLEPKELIRPRKGLSKKTVDVLRNELQVDVTPLEQDFWEVSGVLRNTLDYFSSGSNYDSKENVNTKQKPDYPPALAALRDAENNSQDLALRAFGGCVAYLRRLLLDKELISQGHIELYDPEAVKDSK